MWRLFSSRNIETPRTRPGGPTHWTTLRTALLQEAAEQPAGDGRMADLVLEQGQSWGSIFHAALEVGGARLEERLGPYKLRVPPPEHKYVDQNSGLTEIHLAF
eukprot:COSAG01_NODE_512_length_16051_cov_33.887161_6_plen_103_part_00